MLWRWCVFTFWTPEYAVHSSLFDEGCLLILCSQNCQTSGVVWILTCFKGLTPSPGVETQDLFPVLSRFTRCFLTSPAGKSGNSQAVVRPHWKTWHRWGGRNWVVTPTCNPLGGVIYNCFFPMIVVAYMHEKSMWGSMVIRYCMFWRECITDLGGRKERLHLHFCEVSFPDNPRQHGSLR